MIKFILLFVFIATTIFAKDDLKKVSIQLNWKYQFEFAGFITAKEKGYYKDLGLDVEIREYGVDSNILEDIKSEKATFGIYDVSLLHIKDEQTPIRLIANYFKRSALIFIAKQDILTPSDLKNKIIMADSKQLENSTLSALLKKFGIKRDDYTFRQHNFSSEDFISGKVDVMSAYVSNELFDIKKSKKPYTIIDPLSYEVYGSGLNLFTTKRLIVENPNLVKQFIEATNKGWKYALENKEEIVDLIYDKYSKHKSKEALYFEADQTSKLMMTGLYTIGEINKYLLIKEISYLKDEGLLNKEVSIEDIVYDYKEENDFTLTFSSKQKEYIKNKENITMCIDPDWMPYEKISSNGKHVGMTSDYISLFSKKIGLAIKLIPTKSWSESIEYAKNRKCDIFSLAMATPSRLKYMNFTKPYISFPTVLATKMDKLYIENPEELIEKEKIGIVQGYAIGELLKEKYKDHKIVDVENVDSGMKMVDSGEIFGFLDALPTVAYNLQHKYISELKIAAKFNDKLELGIGVRNDDTILLEIFENVIQSIEEDKKQEILNKYISVKIESSFDYDLIYQILLVVGLLSIGATIRHRQILRYNKALKKQRKKLHKYNNKLHETKDELESSFKNIQVLLNSTIEGIFVFENDICIDVNDVAVKMFEYKSKKEIIGMNSSDFVTKESFSEISHLIKKEKVSSYELKGIKKNKEIFEILVKGTNEIINSKKVRISAVLDITEIKHKDKILFQQSKMAAMGEMLENIAHQWRQPLSMISSASTGLQIQKELGVSNTEQEIEDLKKINNTAQHLSQTIEDFRNFFKPDKKIHEFSVLDVVKRNLLLLQAMFKNGDIEVIIENVDDVIIENYENELAQALVNIFSNAKDAMEEIQTDKFIFINLTRDKEFISIRIKDNAGGINDEIISHIFEPYFTTKHQAQGTGIGLYMTHQIVEKHMKGTINVSNVDFIYNEKKFTGAEFMITLPLS